MQIMNASKLLFIILSLGLIANCEIKHCFMQSGRRNMQFVLYLHWSHI